MYQCRLIARSGGIGLTGCLVDVGDLFDYLIGIYTGQADPEFILDKYTEVRRAKYEQYVNPISTANLIRMSSDTDEMEANDQGLAAMREAEKTIESSRAFQLVRFHSPLLAEAFSC